MEQQAGWKRFLSAYYVVNGLLFAAYIYIRVRYEYEEGSKYSRLSGPGDLFAKVNQLQCMPGRTRASGVGAQL